MGSAEIRAVQGPLKDAYRQNPREALVTLRAHGQVDEQAIACSVDTARRLAVAGPAFDLDTGATAGQFQTLIRLTERYRVVYPTLAHPPRLTMTAGPAPGP